MKVRLTGLAGLAPAGGDAAGASGGVAAGGCQTHGGNAGRHPGWGGQPQQGDVIVEVLGIVVGMSAGLRRRGGGRTPQDADRERVTGTEWTLWVS